MFISTDNGIMLLSVPKTSSVSRHKLMMCIELAQNVHMAAVSINTGYFMFRNE